MSGYNLPPGVTVLDIERAYGDEPAPLPHCERCGGFLPRKPAVFTPWEDAIECDGTVTEHQEPYTEALVAILGDEYRGKSYTVTVAACGIDKAHHAPHREVQWGGVYEYRTCKSCGHYNREVVS